MTGDASNGRLRLHLLGRFEVRSGDCVLVDRTWHRSKAKALIKLLALQPERSLHREQVLDALWPGLDIEAAANNLYKNAHYVRTAMSGFEPLLSMVDGTVALSPDAWIDIDAFRDAARTAFRSGSLGDYEEALGLYTGTLLPDDPYVDWADRSRDEMLALRQRLLLEAGELHAAAGDAAAAEARLREALAADAADEAAHRALMRVFGDARRFDKARRQYAHCREVLERELGVAPSAETEALAAELTAAAQEVVPVEPLNIRHARSDDGTVIAYTTHGSGPGTPLVHMPYLPWSHLQVEWDIPEWRTLINGLAGRRMVVRYDCRGTGLSQHDVEDVSVERQVEDLKAVIDALGLDEVDVFAGQNCGPAVIMYAARHPHRVRRLVLYQAWADGPGFAGTMGYVGLRQMMQHEWGNYCDMMSRAVTGFDEPLAQRIAIWLKTTTGEMTDRFWEATTSVDVTPLLRDVQAPAIVVRRRDGRAPGWEWSRKLAESLPGGRIVELAGDQAHPIAGDIDALVQAINGFLEEPCPSRAGGG
jgi:DNA-binding SARP family transcriptional activator